VDDLKDSLIKAKKMDKLKESLLNGLDNVKKLFDKDDKDVYKILLIYLRPIPAFYLPADAVARSQRDLVAYYNAFNNIGSRLDPKKAQYAPMETREALVNSWSKSVEISASKIPPESRCSHLRGSKECLDPKNMCYVVHLSNQHPWVVGDAKNENAKAILEEARGDSYVPATLGWAKEG
jgi:hypothetical protein